MIKKLLRSKVFVASLVLLISLNAFTARSAANIVSVTHVGDSQRSIRIRDLSPPQCTSIATSLTSISVGSSLNYPANALILGTNAGKLLWGWLSRAARTNCIVTGRGGDWIWGSSRDEIILGGPRNDTIDGGYGTDSFNNCEERY